MSQTILCKGLGKPVKIIYPDDCKELSEELGKDELIRRMKALARAFQDMGQDDNEQYTGLALLMASDYYMSHQNKDVRLLAACCIADVFRIFAPEAPYRDADHLKEIFMFLIKQLRGLEDPASPSFKRYFYLLENLAWVKSFNICIELDDNQEIFCNLFKLMFTIINDKHSSKVKNFILDMMTPLITEADIVSQELLDNMLINIIEPHKTQNKHAYQLAKDLLIRTSNSLEPYIQAFFNNALMLGKMSESEVSDRLYDLIYELNNISPSVLLAVLPQLEFKLKSNEENERKAVTKVLAKMFSDPGSTLADQNKPLWNCFLGRFNDISISVRTTCVQFAQHFVQHHPELIKDIFEQIKVRQHDPEENVRMEVVNTVLAIAKKDFSLLSDELLSFIKERTLDKKFKIRREAMLGLGNLYKSIMGSDPVDSCQMERIDWVKDKVFHAYYQNSNDDRLLVERIFNICLVPYTLPAEERMKRLYLLYCRLDENAIRAFNEMLKHRSNVRNCVTQLIEAHEQTNQRTPIPMNPRLAALARTLPEPSKSLDQLRKLNQFLKDDKRLRYYFKLLVSQDCTCKKAQDAVKEILKKIGGGNPSHQNTLYNTVKYLLERTSPVMIDSSSMDILVEYVNESVQGLGMITDGIDGAAEKGVRLLSALSWVYPYYFNSDETYGNLLTFLKHEDDDIADLALQIIMSTGSKLENSFPNIYSSLLPVLQHTAKLGNPQQSKHAIRCINAVCKNKEPILGQVFEHVKKTLNPDSANFITSIVALGHIAQICPQEFASDMKNIVSKMIVKDLLMQDRTIGPSTTEAWYADHLVMEETHAKIQAMKLLVRWLLGLKTTANNSAMSTLRLLYTVIIHEGDLMEKGQINKPELARMRLQAGCCMLKVAEEPCFAEIITREQFQALALLINDSCYHVRLKFAIKLHKGLQSMKLPLEYMSIFSLAANDPLRERRQQIRQFLQTNIAKRRDYLKQNPSMAVKMYLFLPDYVMPYAIHLLAHDPDLKTHDHVEALKNIKDCLWFIMEPLVSRTEDYNYSFFRRLIENIKQTKDSQGPDDEDMNKKLYAVCDVALGLLKKTTNITLKDSNIEPVLPAKLFTKPDKTYSNTKTYLPKEFNFDNPKKKGVHSLIDTPEKPPVNAWGQTIRTTEILVESPAPVVNPNPKSPTKGSRKKKEEKSHEVASKKSVSQESDKIDSFDTSSPNSKDSDEIRHDSSKSDASDSPSPGVSQESAAKSSSDNSATKSAKGKTKSTLKQKETKVKGVKTKSLNKQTKTKALAKQPSIKEMLVKSPKSANSSKANGKKTMVNGTTKKRGRPPKQLSVKPTPSSKGSPDSDGSSGSMPGSAKKSLKRPLPSSEESTPSKKTKIVMKQTQLSAAKNLHSHSSDSSKSPSPKNSTSSARSTPKSPVAPPKGKQKRSRLTRGNLKEQVNPSSVSSQETDIPSSGSIVSTRRSPAKKEVATRKQTVTRRVAQKNVRQAKKIFNIGTSDGDEETDSSSVTSPDVLRLALQVANLRKNKQMKRRQPYDPN
ncbi:hypothetical protein ScPMuIL_011308 [Solemya velum]